MAKPKNKKAWLYIIPALVLVGVLAFSMFQALKIYIPQQMEQQSFEQLKEAPQNSEQPKDTPQNSEQPKDTPQGLEQPNDTPQGGSANGNGAVYPYTVLEERNDDFVGWLSVEDTVIDYPVMCRPDEPEYYLHRDFYGDYSFSGCLFVGGGCDLSSTSFIIYGHNMSAGTMFGTLDSYADAAFADAHRDIALTTSEGVLVYRVFAAFQTKVYSDNDNAFKYYEQIGNLNEKTYNEAVSSMRALSVISFNDMPKYPAQLMILSTCSYHTDNGRFVVAAYRV